MPEIITIIHRLDRVEESLRDFHRAFPHVGDAPDLDGHRRAHEGMIRAAEAQEKFWNEIRLDVAKKGIIGILIILIGLIVTGLATKIGVMTILK